MKQLVDEPCPCTGAVLWRTVGPGAAVPTWRAAAPSTLTGAAGPHPAVGLARTALHASVVTVS